MINATEERDEIVMSSREPREMGCDAMRGIGGFFSIEKAAYAEERRDLTRQNSLPEGERDRRTRPSVGCKRFRAQTTLA